MNVQLIRAELRVVRRVSLRFMHNGLSLIGLVAVAAAAWLVAHPDNVRTVGQWLSLDDQTAQAAAPAVPDPFAGAIAEPTGEAGRILGLVPADAGTTSDEPVLVHASTEGVKPAATPKDRKELTRYLSRKYRVNNDAVAMLVDAAYVTGKDIGIDPVLLLSVMAIESGFNPFAESTAGASGLMQLMSKVHSDKLSDFGGPNIALNPVANLRVGALVLKDCINRGGSVTEGLRLYVGAGNGPDNGYGLRVLQEKERMLQATRGAAPARPRAEPIPAAQKPESAKDKAGDAPVIEAPAPAAKPTEVVATL